MYSVYNLCKSQRSRKWVEERKKDKKIKWEEVDIYTWGGSQKSAGFVMRRFICAATLSILPYDEL